MNLDRECLGYLPAFRIVRPREDHKRGRVQKPRSCIRTRRAIDDGRISSSISRRQFSAGRRGAVQEDGPGDVPLTGAGTLKRGFLGEHADIVPARPFLVVGACGRAHFLRLHWINRCRPRLRWPGGGGGCLTQLAPQLFVNIVDHHPRHP